MWGGDEPIEVKPRNHPIQMKVERKDGVLTVTLPKA